jgi:hypothetical protein
MASVPSAVNNIKELLCEYPSFYDDEPDEVIEDEDYDCYEIRFFSGAESRNEDEEEGWIELYNDDDECVDIFYNKYTRITHNENKYFIHHKKFRDPVSGKIFHFNKMFKLTRAEIVNEHYLAITDFPGKNTTACKYQSRNNMYDDVFVFNIEDTQKKQALALKMFEKHLEKDEIIPVLPSELVNLISREYFGIPSEYGSSNFKLEFKGTLPQVVSNDQLARLYHAGIIKLAFQLGRYTSNNFIVLSDEAFDDEGVSGFLLRQHYGSKAQMHRHKQTF